YRSDFGFLSRSADVALDAPSFPQGNVIWDEFKEADVEIYRGKFAIEIPYRRNAAVDSLPLTLKLRGCADAGLCYLPQTWQTDLALPAAGQTGITPFGAPAGGASTDLLPLDEAFQLDARFDRADELVVSFRIAPDYYLYRDDFTVAAAGEVELGRTAWP